MSSLRFSTWESRTASFLVAALVMRALAVLACVAVAPFGRAQLPSATATGVRGTFHISVDDTAALFLNGQPIYAATHGESESPEIALKPGDRIVVRLTDLGGVRRFVMAFVATDGRTIVNFPARAFRVLTDATKEDFTDREFTQSRKPPSADRRERKVPLPVRHQSDSVWGDAEVCSLAALLTREMFQATTPTALGLAGSGPSYRVILTIEALVDGPSTLRIGRDRIYWINGGNAKPGYWVNEPTYINGDAWTPKWGQPDKGRGVDRSDNRAVALPTLDLQGELVSNQPTRGVDRIDSSRTPVNIKRSGEEIVVTIPDPEPGARWYKVLFRERRR